MFDKSRLLDALVKYKQTFVSTQWGNEKYKWEAVKFFQDNWDVNAANFASMLTLSLSRTNNLLASMNNYPAVMIGQFAEAAPEQVRAMFIALFDESQDIVTRITDFKDQSSILLKKNGNGAGQHYQYENAVSTYLWLRYPDKYYIYKYNEIRTAADELGSDYRFKKGAYADNLRNFYSFYDELCAEIKKDEELVSLLKSQLTDDCYPDPEYRTLTIDVGFYISRYYSQKESVATDYWFPTDYTPNISVDEWIELLNDPEIFTTGSLEIMKRMKDYGGQATCTQLSIKYGDTKNFYNSGSSALARRIADKTGCPVMDGDEDNSRWWPILYVGHNAGKDDSGSYIWKLRDELSVALDKVDLSMISLYATTVSVDELHSSARFQKWMNPILVALRELGGSASRQEVHEKIVELYEIPQEELDKQNKSGVSSVLNDIDWSRNYIAYEGFLDKNGSTGIWALSALGERIIVSDKLSGMIVAKWTKINTAKRENKPIPQIDLENYYQYIGQPCTESEKYGKADFLNEVYMTESRYEMLRSVLKDKKNIILQGAPGVGKTFAAKRLAYSMIGKKDENRIEFVQFHQNYSYEDFMMGYKPVNDGFELKYGIFYRFCQKATTQPDKDFFFIIDEINRGNMSKIFGELLMLIECDYRGIKATLAYNGLSFAVPKNLYIIGMMNTADRSLAMIDYALRRRFSFFEIEPGYDSEGFVKHQNHLNNETFNTLIERVKELNKEITLDKSLGKGFCIGHSYFCGQTVCSDDWMHSIIDYDILPMLSEYWFDDSGKLQRWENILRGVFQ